MQEIQKTVHINALKTSQESLNDLGLSHCMSVTFIMSYIDACEYVLKHILLFIDFTLLTTSRCSLSMATL